MKKTAVAGFDINDWALYKAKFAKEGRDMLRLGREALSQRREKEAAEAEAAWRVAAKAKDEAWLTWQVPTGTEAEDEACRAWQVTEKAEEETWKAWQAAIKVLDYIRKRKKVWVAASAKVEADTAAYLTKAEAAWRVAAK